MSSLRTQFRYLNPYDLHKLIINDYVLKKPGDTKLLTRDASKDRNDFHVIQENHKFLWDVEEIPNSWELQFAKKYYDKLFKEYCIGDLSLFKENKIALRWRIEKEVITGKGQFICGNKKCDEKEHLRTWEVNFAYVEQGSKKNALVKIRLCPNCSKKLNYHSKKKEIKRLERKSLKPKENRKSSELPHNVLPSTSPNTSQVDTNESIKQPVKVLKDTQESPWESHKQIELKTREEEMEDYLQDLLL